MCSEVWLQNQYERSLQEERDAQQLQEDQLAGEGQSHLEADTDGPQQPVQQPTSQMAPRRPGAALLRGVRPQRSWQLDLLGKQSATEPAGKVS